MRDVSEVLIALRICLECQKASIHPVVVFSKSFANGECTSCLLLKKLIIAERPVGFWIDLTGIEFLGQNAKAVVHLRMIIRVMGGRSKKVVGRSDSPFSTE
jgi:hypothetical protein